MWRSAWSRPTPNKSASAGGLPLPSRLFEHPRVRGDASSGVAVWRGRKRPAALRVQQRGNRGAAESSRVQQRATGYGKMQQGASAGRLRNKVRPPSGRSPQRAALRGAGGRPKPLPTAAVGSRVRAGGVQCSTRLRKPSSSASSRCCAGQLLRRLPSNRLLSRFPVKR